MDLNNLPQKNGFRLRGTDITRLETFTDAAFAFAVTMLVIAGDTVPVNYATLIESLKDIPSFVAGIAMILYIWYGHLQWSRRYGLEDGVSVLLSGMLILSILVFVYPLKLVFAALFSFLSGGYLHSEFVVSTAEEMTGLFVFYGIGFTITCIIIALLFVYALSKKKQLRLDSREIFETKVNIALWFMVSIPAFFSAMAAWLLPHNMGIWSGFIHWLYFIIAPIFSIKTKKIRQALFEN